MKKNRNKRHREKEIEMEKKKCGKCQSLKDEMRKKYSSFAPDWIAFI